MVDSWHPWDRGPDILGQFNKPLVLVSNMMVVVKEWSWIPNKIEKDIARERRGRWRWRAMLVSSCWSAGWTSSNQEKWKQGNQTLCGWACGKEYQGNFIYLMIIDDVSYCVYLHVQSKLSYSQHRQKKIGRWWGRVGEYLATNISQKKGAVFSPRWDPVQ